MRRKSPELTMLIVMLAGVLIGQWLRLPEATGAGTQMSGNQEIVCQSLEVKDERGNTRIRLFVDNSGPKDSGPRVCLYDYHGKCRVQLGIDGDTSDNKDSAFVDPYVAILNRKGGRDVEAYSRPGLNGKSSFGGLSLRDSGESTSIHAGIEGNGGANVTIGSDKDQSGIMFRWIPGSAGVMAISDEGGDTLLALGGKLKEKCSWIDLLTKDGKQRFGSSGAK